MYHYLSRGDDLDIILLRSGKAIKNNIYLRNVWLLRMVKSVMRAVSYPAHFTHKLGVWSLLGW